MADSVAENCTDYANWIAGFGGKCARFLLAVRYLLIFMNWFDLI